ncbi:hypothetical protein [Burkholderia sola]|uniref:hypothetical protein n=1 Tax=Burkholderia sola TaxID=2843302 RepID=UPI0023DE0EBB|nr:hypothetical protein [Burkholderia sola]MDF3081469.1 hypothetical protein [Burkholderia sola]
MRERDSFGPYDDNDDGDMWQQRLYRLRQSLEHDPDEDESPRYRTDQGGQAWPCPSCESFRTEQRHVARRICSAVGAAAGATSATAGALSGLETGAAIGSLIGPAGALCGGIAGAILAGLVAGAAGCATGAAFGEALDQKILDNMLCLACRRTFTVRSR